MSADLAQSFSDNSDLDSDTEEQLLASIYYSKNFNLENVYNEPTVANPTNTKASTALANEEEISKYNSVGKAEQKSKASKNDVAVICDSDNEDGNAADRSLSISSDEINESEKSLEEGELPEETRSGEQDSFSKRQHHIIELHLSAEEEKSLQNEGMLWNLKEDQECSEEELMFSSSESDSDIEKIDNNSMRYYGDEKSTILCFNCKSSGHSFKECPKSNGSMACCFCGDFGHLKSGCPFEICYNCFKPGHQSRACTLPRKRRSTERDQCDRCLQFGHLAKECSVSWRQYLFVKNFNRACFEEGMRKIRKYCYCCSSKGHFGDDCPRSKRRFVFPNSIFRDLTYEFVRKTVYRSFGEEDRPEKERQPENNRPSPLRVKRSLETPTDTVRIIKPRFEFLPPPHHPSSDPKTNSEQASSAETTKRPKGEPFPKKTKPNLSGKNKPQYKGSY